MNKPLSILVALSGGGRTLQNLIEKSKNSGLNINIAGVITSNPKSKATDIALENDIPIFEFDPLIPEDENKRTIRVLIEQEKVDLIVLAGFLKKFPILQGWENRIVNIHPALLPKYGGKSMYGMNVHKKVFENRDKVSGATIHIVNEHYDEGNIVAQIKVDISKASNPEEIAALVFEAECLLYPFILGQIANNKLNLSNFSKPIILDMSELRDEKKPCR